MNVAGNHRPHVGDLFELCHLRAPQRFEIAEMARQALRRGFPYLANA